jgi:endonuclease/exonuclease/phosphatase family metal-dependent hydrolase
MNTHFDHKGKDSARRISQAPGQDRGRSRQGLPVIITGDFNVTEDDPPYATLVKPEDNGPPKLADAYREVHPQRSKDESSFNGFKGNRRGSRIDWSCTRRSSRRSTRRSTTRTRTGRYPSDHYPVHVELRWATK